VSSYVEAHLLQGEKVLYQAQRSPVAAYSGAVVFAVTGIVLAVLLRAVPLFGLGILLALIAAAGGFLQLKSSEYAVTNRRVLVKQGVIVRKSMELLLGKVEGISVDQNIAGRIFGYGSVTVNGTGGGRDPFKGVDKPFELRKAVQHQLEVANSDSAASE
jgi:uncharacterized membrane protein YdbT with pleckstrin-like domain